MFNYLGFIHFKLSKSLLFEISMKLSKNEVKKALLISKTIQKTIESTGSTNMRSTDVFPYLVKKGLFEEDRHNGVYFRRFLNRLAKLGELQSLIPQCTRVNPVKDEIFSEWYFHDAKDQMPKSKYKIETNLNSEITQVQSQDLEEESLMSITEATDIVKALIAGVNPITGVYLDNQDVCLDPMVSEALEVIINPDSYDLYKIREKAANKTLLLNKEIWYNQTQSQILKWPSDISADVNKANIIEIRKSHPRAFEKWTDAERDILKKANELFDDKKRIACLLQRTEGSILAMLKHLEGHKNILEYTDSKAAPKTETVTKQKFLSATALGKLKDKNYQDVINTMISKEYIEDSNIITYIGQQIGLKHKHNSKGEKWIVYPHTLADIL